MHQLGQPEIQHLHLPAWSQENVRRLDIAMHDPLGMRRCQCVRHLDADIKQLLRLHRMSGNALLQALALQLLHHDERMPVVIFNAVDGADVRDDSAAMPPALPARNVPAIWGRL
jgi:hypothetical protein